MSGATSLLPLGLDRSFQLAAAELGMCSAAWLLVETLHRQGGNAAVEALADALGNDFPVLGQVTDQALRARDAPVPHAGVMLEALGDCSSVLVVGLEARWLDVLVPALAGRRVAVLAEGMPQANWERVAANLHDAVDLLDMSSVQRRAGHRSALVTFLYGVTAERIHVVPAWLRVMGPDIRTQFRSIIGWDVLGEPMDRYPRFLAETTAEDFTAVVA